MRPTTSILLTHILVLGLTAAVTRAADTPTAAERADRPQRDRLEPRQERLGYGAKATDIIGMEVKNMANTKLGKVDELAVDLESGRVVEVIVSSGGVLGVGDKLIAVPPQAFKLDPPTKALRLVMDRDVWKTAPSFDISKWDDSFQSNHVADVYRYYKQEPYFMGTQDAASRREFRNEVRKGDRTEHVNRNALGRVEKASKVIGENIRNLSDQKVGDVDNLIVDLEAGRIIHVIVASGGFLGLGEALSAVPPAALREDPAHKYLRMDTTKEALADAPHFKKSDWPKLDDPDYAQKVYRAHHVEPYFGTDVDNTARNVRERQGALTPGDQGTSEADMDMTRRIRKEIIAQDQLSLYGRNVKVITLNGRVTLRGPVQSEEEKQRIGDIANRIAKPENVDNQLEVKRDADTK